MTIEAIDLECIELFEACGQLNCRTDDGDRIALSVLVLADDETDDE